jgi:hypothetical protein
VSREGGLSCHGALPEADRLARWNDAWRRPKAYEPLRRDTAHKTRSVVWQRAECSWSRVSAKRNCRHIWNRICGIATMLICRALAHKNLGAPPATTDAHNLSRKAVAFGIILTVRNGNASDLIAPRRDPPRRGRQDRPSVANRSLRTTTLQKTKHGLQDGTLLSIWGVALACVCLGCRRP